jgi:putative two-component system response regulator
MKSHASLGKQALLAAIEDGVTPTEFLRYAIDIAGSHHEKWNGTGYPDGLSGEQIPLAARLMAVADVYDALRSKRVYKPPFSHERAVEIISGDSGTHFDPAIVAAFLRCEGEFQRISETYVEAPADKAA